MGFEREENACLRLRNNFLIFWVLPVLTDAIEVSHTPCEKIFLPPFLLVYEVLADMSEPHQT